jgi:hypothetical protein
MRILGFGRKDPGKEIVPANYLARVLDENPELPRVGKGWP